MLFNKTRIVFLLILVVYAILNLLFNLFKTKRKVLDILKTSTKLYKKNF